MVTDTHMFLSHVSESREVGNTPPNLFMDRSLIMAGRREGRQADRRQAAMITAAREITRLRTSLSGHEAGSSNKLATCQQQIRAARLPCQPWCPQADQCAGERACTCYTVCAAQPPCQASKGRHRMAHACPPARPPACLPACLLAWELRLTQW